MELTISNPEYLYEVQALIKAFYPETGIHLTEEGNAVNKDIERIQIKAEEELAGISFIKNGIPVLNAERIVERGTRREYKNALKHLIYSELSQLTGRKLPWGTLTGVRPTKLIMELMEQGIQREAVMDYMDRVYDCSVNKAMLGIQIVSRELALLESMDYKNGYSIYIGIPFCPTTCLYCSFASYSLERYGMYTEPYLEALYQEMEYAAGCMPEKKLCTVYIGGGTPTALSADQLAALCKKVKDTLDFTYVKEFTVEAGRPDSITMEKLKVLKEYGVTRISVNPQTMKQETLDIIGRRHTVEEIREAFHKAREAGHDNINMDLIVGLPGEDCGDVTYTLEEVAKLDPDSVTIHSLAIKRAAELKLKTNQYESPGYDEVEEMVVLGEEFAGKYGYAPYYLYRQKNTTGSKMTSRENIGYAKQGKEGLYNILIMEEKQTILALGAGATSKFVFHDSGRLERVENVKFVKDYIERIDEMIQRKRSFMEREY